MPRPNSYVPALDGVRGLAIALVLASHLCPEIAAGAGWSGVDLFFVLSGYLITGLLLDGRAAPDRARRFYTRRALRIFPLYYATLVLVFVLVPAFRLPFFSVIPRHAATYQSTARELEWFWPYLSNWYIGLVRPGQPGPLTHFWSLAVEEQFYLVWPLIVWHCSPRTSTRVAIGALLGSLALRVAMVASHAPYLTVYMLTPCRLDGLAVGALIALGTRSESGLVGTRRVILPLASVGAAILVILSIWRQTLFSADPWVLTIGLAAAAWLYGGLVVVALSYQSSTLAWAPLRWIGERSYGLYVLHPFVMFALTTFTALQVGTVAYAGVALAASAIVAEISYAGFERPFLSLKDRLAPTT
jgi:peptidoglycan/LPS O-acetylase OafA/YrhL